LPLTSSEFICRPQPRKEERRSAKLIPAQKPVTADTYEAEYKAAKKSALSNLQVAILFNAFQTEAETTSITYFREKTY
jgi:hypothetical protein